MEFPVNFEEKVKMGDPPNGAGYPYRISAKDLMDDFKFAALDVASDQDANGVQLSIETKNNKRILSAKLNPLPTGGGTGSITFVDCEGAEVGRIDWSNGVITTESNQIIEAGCNASPYSFPI